MQLNFDDTQIHKSPEQLRREKLDIKIQKIKSDLAPGVVKYMMKTKNNRKLQIPLHNVEYHPSYNKPQFNYLRTFQKMDLEPLVQLDEIKEERWSILSQNCKNILEKSRISLGKPNESQFSRLSSNEQFQSSQKQIKNNNKFLTRRQSIDLRIDDIKTPQQTNIEQKDSSPNPKGIKMDPYYVRFKKYYKKIGINQDEQPNIQKNKFQNIQKKSFTHDKIYKINSPQRLHQSYFIFPSVQCSPQTQLKCRNQKQKTQQQYLQNILTLCNLAQHFQMQMKKDETENYSILNKKIEYIRSEFNKYHNMINDELDSNDGIEIQ